jgi:60 kDa SS-A/Ro ribonucleoprotein
MRFNFSLKSRRRTANEYEHVKTWMPDPQWELYKALITASLNGSIYERMGYEHTGYEQTGYGKSGSLSTLRSLIRQNEGQFVIRVAVWLRETMGMKSISLMVTAELAALYRNSEPVSLLVTRVIQQVSDIPEFLEYYALANGSKNGKPLDRTGRQLEKSLSAVFNRLDEYQFTRYDRVTQLKVKYALSHIRPKGKDKAQRVLFGKILRDSLPARSTWEGERDALQLQNFDSQELKQTAGKDKWKEWISSFRIGYPALLENLQSILTAGVSGKVLKLVAEYLGNGAAVARNRPSPFRILEAYRELQTLEHGGTGMLSDALEQAAVYSAGNLAGFEEDSRLVIAMDVSNSMKRPIRDNSLIQRFDIAPLLALLLQNKGSQVTAGIVGNTWKWIDLRARRPLAALNQFHGREGEAGYATNGYLVIQDLLKRKQVVDKVMIFSDSQLWYNRPFNQSAGTDIRKLWRQYRLFAPDARICLFDLSGQGNTRLDIPEEGVLLVSGWNERIFDVLKAVENSTENLERINDITL